MREEGEREEREEREGRERGESSARGETRLAGGGGSGSRPGQNQPALTADT